MDSYHIIILYVYHYFVSAHNTLVFKTKIFYKLTVKIVSNFQDLKGGRYGQKIFLIIHKYVE